jgi:hypothetical protein
VRAKALAGIQHFILKNIWQSQPDAINRSAGGNGDTISLLKVRHEEYDASCLAPFLNAQAVRGKQLRAVKPERANCVVCF